jgi:hypothetical protein
MKEDELESSPTPLQINLRCPILDGAPHKEQKAEDQSKGVSVGKQA